VSLAWAVEHTFALVGDAAAGAGTDDGAGPAPGATPDGASTDGDGATPVGVVAG
jgi:hypothetical protein